MTDRVRPPEPPPATPDEQHRAGDLARQAHQTAGALTGLVEQMEQLGWRTDDYTREDLAAVANSLAGMAIRAGMESGDATVMTEVTGRPGRFGPGTTAMNRRVDPAGASISELSVQPGRVNAMDTVTTPPVVPGAEDAMTCECGCWCGYCPCEEDELRAVETDAEYSNSSHCCECGRTGNDCEYHCTCS